jgi:Fe-S oxidoreductase
MAAFKAEFLHHYHRDRPRPRQAWSMGRVQRWLAIAARAPRLSNALLRIAPVRALARWAGGLAPQRRLPSLAPRGFRAMFLARGGVVGERGVHVAPRAPGEAPRGRVLLWADTFNEHLRPEVAQAAVRALEAAGFEVAVPPAGLCCGRPLYDFGLLDQAAAQFAALLDALAATIDAGTPVVGLEPACVSAFRDELLKLFPDDARAKRLAAQVVTLPELLVRERVELPPLEATVLVQAHCHQRALGGTRADEQVLDAMGVRHQWVEAGCCGMAGSFGFHPDHYPLSVKAAELSLLPALRARAPGTRVVACGYSCREQVEQLGDCLTEHLVELIAEAFDRRAAAREDRPAGGRRESTIA